MNLRERRAAETVSLIITAAEELFGSKGYENTTVNDIVKKCGMTKGAFYHYYKSKEEVLEKVFTNHYDAIYEAIEPVLNNSELPWEEKLYKVIGLSRGVGLKKKSFISEYINIRHNYSDPFLKDRLRKHDIKHYKKIISRILDEGRDSGDCSFVSTGEVMAVFIYQIDIAVTDEVNNILNSEYSDEEKQKKLKELLEGSLHTISSMLGVDVDKMRKIINPDAALEFLKTIVKGRDD